MDETRRPNKRYSGKPYQKGRRTGYGGGGSRYNQSQLGNSTAAEDLAEYILKILARDPDALQFERQQLNPGRSIVNVTCDPAVTGRLIGKDGKTISALRALIRAAGTRSGKRVDIEVS
ncbi:MAG TPA: KH domain-containing protein [Oculatellaceae cyanobacterium]